MMMVMMIWYDMIWYDMKWYDMIWYDMIWYDGDDADDDGEEEDDSPNNDLLIMSNMISIILTAFANILYILHACIITLHNITSH